MSSCSGILTALILLSCQVSTVFSQVTDGEYEIMTTNHGLPSNVLRKVYIDAQGFVWVGSEYALSRYDGYQFKTYSRNEGDSTVMAGNIACDMTVTSSGELWIGFENGRITKYSGTGFRTVDYGLPNSNVTKIFEDRSGNIWIALAKHGLFKYDSAAAGFQKVLDLNGILPAYKALEKERYNTIYDIFEDHLGNLWLATHDGLYYYDLQGTGLSAVREKEFNSIPDVPRNDLFTKIIPSDSGLWLASWGGGIQYYNYKQNKWSRFEYEPDDWDLANLVNYIEYAHGKIWLSAPGHGFAEFDPVTKEFNFYYKCDAQNLIADKSGIIWGASTTGLIKFEPNIGVKYKRFDQRTSCVTASKDEGIFVATILPTQLTLLDKSRKVKKTWKDELVTRQGKYELVEQILDDKTDTVWVLTNTSLSFVKKSSLQFSRVHVDWTADFSKVIKRNGYLYLASYEEGGVMRYNLKTNHLERSYLNSPMVPRLWDFELDGYNRLWLISDRKLFVYDLSKQRYVTEKINLPPNAQATSVCVSRLGDKILVGTYNYGAFEFGTKDMTLVGKWTRANSGLQSNLVKKAFYDNDGNRWFNLSATTVCIIEKTNNSVSYDTPLSTGQISYTTGSAPTILITAYDGYYELLSPQGAARVPQNNPLLALGSFNAADNKLEVNYDADSVSVILPENMNSFSAEYALADFYNSYGNIFETQLIGFDEVPTISNRNYISYNNLPPGNFQLTIRGKSSRRIPAKNTLRIHIKVTAPFYRTWYFKSIVGALAVVGLFFIYDYRVKKLVWSKRANESELKALRAQLNPHFIFNTLNSINKYILSSKIEAASSYLVQFSKLIRKILENSSQSMVPLAEELSALRNYLQLELLRLDYRFAYNFEIDENINVDEIQIPPMILQPFFENSIWHGMLQKKGMGIITMKVKKIDPGRIEFIIEDNGIGLSGSAKRKNGLPEKKSIGIGLIKKRIKMLSQEFKKETELIFGDRFGEDGSVQGTRVTLRLPMVVVERTEAEENL